MAPVDQWRMNPHWRRREDRRPLRRARAEVKRIFLHARSLALSPARSLARSLARTRTHVLISTDGLLTTSTAGDAAGAGSSAAVDDGGGAAFGGHASGADTRSGGTNNPLVIEDYTPVSDPPAPSPPQGETEIHARIHACLLAHARTRARSLARPPSPPRPPRPLPAPVTSSPLLSAFRRLVTRADFLQTRQAQDMA